MLLTFIGYAYQNKRIYKKFVLGNFLGRWLKQ